ncbi:MAG: phosphoglycerate kinase [Patescibacteria group bacterium]
MQGIKSVRDADVKGKRVMVRVDFNVPIADGVVADDTRIKAALPTLNFLREKGAAEIIVVTHLGRPGGKIVEELRVAPVAKRLRELFDAPNVSLLENILFDPREAANDVALAQELAQKADIFVNDAFADLHRPYATHLSLPRLLPSYAGLLVETEIEHLSQALTPPQGSIALIGGAKFETKEPLLKKLLDTYSELLLGGALANDVLKARGWPVGASHVSELGVPVDIAGNERLVVPTDATVREGEQGAERTTLVVDTQIGEAIIDIGPATAAAWAQKIAAAPFVLWNGPMGIYELGFTLGTDTLAEAITKSNCKAVVGGGDTVAALKKFTFDPEKVFISTGGGAMLEFLMSGTLPGLDALRK